MSAISPKWNFWDKIMLLICISVVLYPLSMWYLPAIEGNSFPVTTPAELRDPEQQPPPDYRFVWEAQAEKIRDCEYVLGSLKWYLGTSPLNRQQVFAEFLDKPQIRGPGILHWDGLRITLDSELVLSESYATVRHQCPWRWWQTETLFYVSG